MNEDMYEIWHNPRCSKSRETLQILRDNNIDPNIREYLTDTPTKETLQYTCMILGVSPIEITRIGEKLWKENGLDPKTMSEEDLYDMLAFYPQAIERPIVIKDGDSAIIGRPPENVKALLL